MYELIDTVDRCFCEIINDQDFILGLDTTGVFAFTESSNKEEVQLSFYDLKKDLQLSDRQAVLCYVGEKHPGFKNEVLLTDLENWIREATSKRPRIFSKDDLHEVFNSENIGRVWTIVSNEEKNIARIEEGHLWK